MNSIARIVSRTIKNRFPTSTYEYLEKCYFGPLSLFDRAGAKRRSAFADYIASKRVVIVGPSPGLSGKGKGKVIDNEYDVVVRINRAVPIPADLHDDYGSRTDVLGHRIRVQGGGGPDAVIDPKLWIKCGVKYVYCSISRHHHQGSRRVEEYLSLQQDEPLLVWPTRRQYVGIVRGVGCMPTTGTATIWNLLQYDLKELHVTGMTFMVDGYLKSYDARSGDSVIKCDSKKKLHDHVGELRYFAELTKRDSRITYDERLHELID